MRCSLISIFILLIIVLPNPSFGQTANALHSSYTDYRHELIKHRRFKHKDVMEIVSSLASPFTVNSVGKSLEGREIKMVSFGEGSVSVLLWSQMHGNESTATMALMDMFNFLQAEDPEFQDLRDRISNNLTVHFIPMLNPDGAQRFQRRNMQGIDINRDALRLQTPEGRTLKVVRDSLDADWGFNLHDQSRYTSTGTKPATISVLAPAYNYPREINEIRGDAISLIAYLSEQIAQFLPEQIGRYGDAFEPRAFGDNIQKWGTRTILVESGGYQADREKQYIRQVNFVLLLLALESIATRSFVEAPHETYFAIPPNRGGLHDLILRNVKYEGIVRDVAFRYQELENEQRDNYYLKGQVSDLGDLSTSSSYEEFDAAGYAVEAGKFGAEPLANGSAAAAISGDLTWKQGHTDFVVLGDYSPFTAPATIRLHSSTPKTTNQSLAIGSNPSLLLKRNGRIEYILVNGHLLKRPK